MKPTQPEIEPPPTTALTLIERMAADPSVDPAKLREILAVKQQWEADESRKAFAAAMARFQSLCPIIPKGDTANGRAYARIDRIHRTIKPLLDQCGIWFSWNVCEEREGGLIYLEGILGHSTGHQVPCKQLIPLPDAIKGTNAAQRAGSGQSYARRYGECLALGIVTGEDDDGNAGKRTPSSSPDGVDDKALRAELWEMLKPISGDDKTWNTARAWLSGEGCMDASKKITTMTAQELREVIQKAQQKL